MNLAVLLLAQVPWLTTPALALLLVVVGLLCVALVVGEILSRQPETAVDTAAVGAFVLRVRSLLLLAAVLGGAFLLGGFGENVGKMATVFMFFVLSFWALREFITLTPTRTGDHRALFWVFIIFTPLQYFLIALDVASPDVDYFHRIYSILIPVYASLIILSRVAISGDPKRFLERTAKIQLGLMICVYTLSFAPALLGLDLITSQARGAPPPQPLWNGSNAGVLFYFVLVVQFGDMAQFVWDRMAGRRVIAPEVSPSKTWEGLLGSVLSATLLGMLLWWVTPFTMWEAACLASVCSIAGFAGTMTMSAIKRDRGVTDYGTLVQGHAGIFDRIDSICFAAPVFYHFTRLFFSRESLWPQMIENFWAVWGA